MTDNESLFDRLKSMGMQVGASHIRPSQSRHPDRHAIEVVVNGEEFETHYGHAFLTREKYPAGHWHGSIPLCADCDTSVLAAWASTQRITRPGGQNVVFLDTETTGLGTGTGTYAFLVGAGFRTGEGFELVQFFMRGPEYEPALLAALDNLLSRFDVIVTFNGKTFDLPLLNARYTINGFSSPFDNFEHLDVLHVARRLWRDRLPSRALGDLEREIVQFYRTADEVPGWLIPQLYFDYLASGDARPLKGVFYHNAIDILSLACLYGHIAGVLQTPLDQHDNYALDLAAIARMYEEMGWLEKAAQLYERSLALGDLPEAFFYRTIERYALLRRKQGDWSSAARLWKQAAEQGEMSACIELAKYYEHRERNDVEALFWARKALDLLDGGHAFAYTHKAVEKEIERRIGRLYRRVYREIKK